MGVVPGPEDSFRMMELVSGFQVSQALYVAARLEVATELLDGPRTIEALAAATGAHPGALSRLVRTLAPLGVFQTSADNTVSVTPFGATLASNVPGSLHGIARFFMETHYSPFGELLHTLRTNEPASVKLYGKEFHEDPERVAVLTNAMSDVSEGWRASVLWDYQLPEGARVADIGGADGSMLARMLQGEPDRRGIVFDRPEVATVADVVLADRLCTQSPDSAAAWTLRLLPVVKRRTVGW